MRARTAGAEFQLRFVERLLTAANPESGGYSYTYNNNGNVTERTDAGRGIHTNYSYDALNRPTGVSYDDGATPNGVGQPQAVTSSNGAGQVFGSYDSLGNEQRAGGRNGNAGDALNPRYCL